MSFTVIILICILWFIFRRSIKTVATNADSVAEAALQHVNDLVGVNALEAQVEIQRRSSEVLANLSTTDLIDPLAEYRKLRGLK